MRIDLRSTGRLLAVASILLGLWAAAATAAEPTREWGVVMARDLEASTLQVDERVYQVTATTVIKDLDGQSISLAALPVYDVHRGLFDLADATKVEIVAMPTATGHWVLQSVRMIDRLPH